jgi:hypothetical protein
MPTNSDTDTTLMSVPGAVLANLSVDKDGRVQVLSAQLGDAKEIVVIDIT